ncbi:MAG: transposase [bacterium]|nr:transposase [bacterium]
MENKKQKEPHIERVDDLPVLFGLLQQMRIQEIVDAAIMPHGNWDGLSHGWVITIWLMYILSQQDHRMEPVQEWVKNHVITLYRLTGQEVVELDFSDDRLALCLKELSKQAVWHPIEAELGVNLLRIYDLKPEIVRLDATVGTVSHDPAEHTLFKVGKAKNGLYETQFKIMLASLDPLGLPIVVDVEPGSAADDPLYVPCYQRAKQIITEKGLLIVGDSKMSALGTRGEIVVGEDYYLMPLAWLKDEPTLLDELLKGWSEQDEVAINIFLPQDRPEDGSEPDPELALGYGFEVIRSRESVVQGENIIWDERLLVIRSHSYTKTMQEGLYRRLDKAEDALKKLTPARSRGKRQIKDEASLLSAIERIEKKYRVQGLFQYSYQQEVKEQQIRAYKGKPARTERQVRYQLTVSRNQAAIAEAEAQAGWRIYASNAPSEKLSLSQAVLAYRDQYLAENIFRRLQGKLLSITPLYVQLDDHAQGLFHLLTLGSRLLALGDYQAKRALAKEGPDTQLTGIYQGNSKRGTARPTTERMLMAFDQINLLLIPSEMSATDQEICFVTPLSPVQERILALLGLPTTLYTSLQLG